MANVKEIRALTGLRGVAAVYVVLFHYWTGVGFSSAARTFLSHGYLAVDVFFVLSGFVMTLNYVQMFQVGPSWHSMKSFLGRRLARVYPLYLVTTVCAIVLLWHGWMKSDALDSVAFHQFSTSHLLGTIGANLAMIQTWGVGPTFNSPAWSISAEWAAYLLFPTALWAGSDLFSAKSRIAVLLAIAWIALCCWSPTALAHRPHPEALLNLYDFRGGWPVLRSLPEFFLGAISARVYIRYKAATEQLSGYAAVLLCAVLFLLLTLRQSDFFFVLLCPLFILSMASSKNPVARVASSRPLHHLGMISYSIYLVHDLLGGLVSFIHRVVSQHGEAHGQTYGAVAAIVLTYPLSLIAFYCVERPCRRLALTKNVDRKTETRELVLQ